MQNTNKELERIQNELLAEEDISLDDLLADAELNDLLSEPAIPAFDDPDKIHDPAQPLVYQNYANDYGAQEQEADAQLRKKDDTVVMALMITASVLCLGILGILGYWLNVLL